MKQTKIDWCDCTINPIVGCKNGCSYCYARKINDRFHFIDNWNEPQFFSERLKQLSSKKPKSIFMDSMSDCGWWTIPQIKEIAKAIKKNPQHNYLFLTKRPDLFIEKCKSIVEDANKGNVFVGTSITRKNEIYKLNYLPICASRFISVEPILEDFGDISNTDLCGVISSGTTIIIGAETGNRKNKIVPKKEWISNIVNAIDKRNVEFKNLVGLDKYEQVKIRIFMKSSLKDIMGEDFRQDELIWSVKKE